MEAAFQNRRVVRIVAAVVVLAVITGSSVYFYQRAHTRVPLYSGTVALDGSGQAVEVADSSVTVIPGTRVIAGTSRSVNLAASQKRWLRAGTIPAIPELYNSNMVADALLDLHVLGTDGVPVAAWTPHWRYVWPRDSAFIAAALARTGHYVEAEQLISFLTNVQPTSELFEARYLPDGTGVPDARGVQTDGVGWAMWGMLQVLNELPVELRPNFLRENRQLIERSVTAAHGLVAIPQSLPPPSADYWEVKEKKFTLSTAAMVHVALICGADLYGGLGEFDKSDDARSDATRLLEAITAGFSGDGYPRRLGGGRSSVDLGVSFLLPPFTTTMDPEVVRVWEGSATYMARPAGGLSPGGSWKNDGISWTTSTSSRAVTAAFVGNRSESVRWLQWLDAHRTKHGPLPEKVTFEGRPAAVAPLAWTAVAVIIAVDELGKAQ